MDIEGAKEILESKRISPILRSDEVMIDTSTGGQIAKLWYQNSRSTSFLIREKTGSWTVQCFQWGQYQERMSNLVAGTADVESVDA